MNTSKAELRHGSAGSTPVVQTAERSTVSVLWLGLLILAGLVLRLLFMGNEGFRNDVQSFEAWAITLAQHPFSKFYSSTSFADYPPGYFYVLWVVGHVWALLSPHGGNYDLLKYLVKLPAVVMDLVDGVLVYAIVRRFAGERWALAAAAIFVLNPAMIFISAAWGQVDAVSSGLALFGVYLLLRSDDGASTSTTCIVLAWISLAYSLLIKPQAAVLIPLFIVFAFTRSDRLRSRLVGTGIGIVAALVFGLLLTLPFHPTGNPVDAYSWLLGKYTFAKNVYAYNSVNAFNLWSILHGFWEPDSQNIGILPQYVWGVALVVAAVILTVVRYWQAKTEQALLESAALVTLAFFMLATRMHERYIYDGLTFTIVCLPFARRYLWASVIFSATLFVNLFYSLQYLSVVSNSTSGVDPRDMWPFVTHPLSILNVATFFALGYLFLGQDAAVPLPARGAPAPSPLESLRAAGYRARAWFNPGEGLASMVWPLDYVLASLFGVVSFVVSFVNYWLPNKTDQCWSVAGATHCGVFDEIYFARAAEEYIHGLYIYENTHPPLTKLIITLSTMLFGDTTAGWRLLDVVFGAIAIVIIYAFAKRLTRSTLFASFAAITFTADGMHFVQSRIATPEGIVVVFSLGALYAFYRFWIASQSTVRAFEPRTLLRAGASLGGAIVLGAISGGLADYFGNPPHQADTAGFIVSSIYFSSGWYLLLRLVVVPRLLGRNGELITYAEGTRALRSGGAVEVEPPYNEPFKKDLTIKEEEASITYHRDGSVDYQTPEGSATYTPGMVVDDRGEREEGKHATTWLVAFTLLLGALVASKWYGVMAYGVSFIVIGFVWLQRYWAEGRAKRWGNPFGFRLDVALAAIAFISMSVYVCAWIPELVRHVSPPGDTGAANVSELVYRQYTMFEYHDTLKATHPYQSAWWQWPLDLRPIAYYWKDLRTGAGANDPNGCCVSEITSLPNPLILWFGLLCVPLVAILAWYEKNKGYALLVLAYLLQWLPWAKSPRITFAYHFYVDIPIIVLCNVIILQRLWNWHFPQTGESRLVARFGVCTYVLAVVVAFIWFYPILSGTPIRWNQWDMRMWLGSHWI
ncbi:MAG TPA: glycosyltransferase family 39 protein [Candidatus Baltobacteraceae bacterium]|nr:glycosyltransferase family 39 protein [Candidatus Baltobacteraceae bacterium]